MEFPLCFSFDDEFFKTMKPEKKFKQQVFITYHILLLGNTL